MKDAIEVPDDDTRKILNNNPLGMALRGYEVARLSGTTWERVGAFTATETGRLSAIRDAKWLQERHPSETYAVRPVVSLDPVATAAATQVT